MNESLAIFIGVLLFLVFYIRRIFRNKKATSVSVRESGPETQVSPRVHVESVRDGSFHLRATSKGAVLRLAGGTQFSGIVNGKKIKVKADPTKAWEEFVIET